MTRFSYRINYQRFSTSKSHINSRIEGRIFTKYSLVDQQKYLLDRRLGNAVLDCIYNKQTSFNAVKLNLFLPVASLAACQFTIIFKILSKLMPDTFS